MIRFWVDTNCADTISVDANCSCCWFLYFMLCFMQSNPLYKTLCCLEQLGIFMIIYVFMSYKIINDYVFLITCCKMFVVVFGMIVALLLNWVLVFEPFHPIGVYKGNKETKMVSHGCCITLWVIQCVTMFDFDVNCMHAVSLQYLLIFNPF